MIRVNLLPFRAARKRENIRRQISVFILSILLTCAVIAYVHINLTFRIKSLATSVENTKKDLKKYNAINREIAAIKKKLNILNKKMGVIEGLEANRFEPVRLMDMMTQVVIPQRMWFTSFTFSGNNINIKGIAIDNKTVADFMTRLEQTQLFSSVSLKTLKHRRIRGTNLKSFDINCSKKPAVKPEKAKAKT